MSHRHDRRSGGRSREESDCINPDCDGAAAGLAQSLAQPDSNVTGCGTRTRRQADQDAQTSAAGPSQNGMVSRVREDYRQDSPRSRASEAVARSLNFSLELGEFDVDTAETAISAMAARGVQGLVYRQMVSPFHSARRSQTARSVTSCRPSLPSAKMWRREASCPTPLVYPIAAFFVDRILKTR